MSTSRDQPLIPDWARRPQLGAERPLVLVGPCAAGKSTLRASLRALGELVVICAQEHSEIPHLWALSEPASLIYLSVSLAAIRRRRADPDWPAAVYRRQLQRLSQALACCDLYIDTSERTVEEVLAIARQGLAASRAILHQSPDCGSAIGHDRLPC